MAIGTGLNLPHYPAGIRLTGIEWSPAMLERARQRAATLGRDVDLQGSDARALAFPDGAFDTVVCTFSLCGIPDDRRALAEMVRVLRPGGRLLLADHVAASPWPVRVWCNACSNSSPSPSATNTSCAARSTTSPITT